MHTRDTRDTNENCRLITDANNLHPPQAMKMKQNSTGE